MSVPHHLYLTSLTFEDIEIWIGYVPKKKKKDIWIGSIAIIHEFLLSWKEQSQWLSFE